MANPGSMNTLLVLTPLSGYNTPILTPYSVRGITQTLEPITGTTSGSNVMGTLVRRSVNGNLVDLTYPWFRKYASTVTCRDQETPCLDGTWLGEIVQVDCACELSYPMGGTPQRPEMSGSSRTEVNAAGTIVFYRPQLVMMIVGINNSFSEWDAEYQWSISMQEL